MINKFTLTLLVIVTGALARFYGVNWDQGHHLHPDERFLTMVTLEISIPSGLSQYLDTRESPANPNNVGFPFYVYGIYPVLLVKIVSQYFGMDTYLGITIVGRIISGLCDVLSIYVVYLLSMEAFRKKTAALASSLCYSLYVLPIQLSHFYAVDTFVTLFLSATFLYCSKLLNSKLSISSGLMHFVFIGLFFGLAISAKISAALFLPVVLVVFILISVKDLKKIPVVALGAVIFLISLLLTLKIFDPYLFMKNDLNPEFIKNIQQLKSFDNPDSLFPPSVQWIKAVPIVFPFLNIFYWGLGPVMCIVMLLSLVFCFKRIFSNSVLGLMVFWIIFLFMYQSFQFAKAMRYFYPIYPFMAVVSGYFLVKWKSGLKKYFLYILGFLVLIWPISFLSIYSRPHSRVSASQWIIGNLSYDRNLSCEYWDDCLPLPVIPNQYEEYHTLQLDLFAPDTSTKWDKINMLLQDIDYLILSSNRLYGSIQSVPEKYPITSVFYTDLFSSKSNFKIIKEFASRPGLPIPGIKICIVPPFLNYGGSSRSFQDCSSGGITFVDDFADETFTVYDHPKVHIFENNH